MLTKAEVEAYRCPRWADLPDLALYMDQIVVLIQEALKPFCEPGEVAITPSMVNNYVKQKIIAAPQKKKYDKTQITKLIVISLFKRVFSITEITRVISLLTQASGIEQAYDMFCQRLEEMLHAAFMHPECRIECVSYGDTGKNLMEAALVALMGKLVVQYRLTEMLPKGNDAPKSK